MYIYDEGYIIPTSKIYDINSASSNRTTMSPTVISLLMGRVQNWGGVEVQLKSGSLIIGMGNSSPPPPNTPINDIFGADGVVLKQIILFPKTFARVLKDTPPTCLK